MAGFVAEALAAGDAGSDKGERDDDELSGQLDVGQNAGGRLLQALLQRGHAAPGLHGGGLATARCKALRLGFLIGGCVFAFNMVCARDRGGLSLSGSAPSRPLVEPGRVPVG